VDCPVWQEDESVIYSYKESPVVGSVVNGAMVGVALTAGLQTVFLKSASLNVGQLDSVC
jgi:hypothetical protein